MITLILGKKGSGKTKKLMDLCNVAVEQSKGNVVFIEKDNTLTYDLSHKARLVAAEDYAVRCYGCFYGFIAGMCAGNYDITDIFVDSTLKICGDVAAFETIAIALNELATKAEVNIAMTVSAPFEELSADLQKMVL